MALTKRPSLPQKVKKRDGSFVTFDRQKIESAIRRAAFEELNDEVKAANISKKVTEVALQKIKDRFKAKAATIEAIQDIVEAALMEEGYSHIARSYILYRQKRSEIRFAKSAFGLKDDLKLPVNTIEVLKKRYLLKDDKQNIIETPSELFRRVACCVAGAEANYNSKFKAEDVEEKFYQMMRNLEFLPNSPTLMNAGTSIGQLSACFVLPVEDSMDSIFEALKNMAKIHQTGGGTGFSFSKLRPKGDTVSSTKGQASGPVSFMSIFDAATGVIVQGGRRRGANMGILRCDHPDIVDFIEAKREPGCFENFNLSVAVTDRFMADVKADRYFYLKNPRTGKKVRKVRARGLFDLMVNAAWRTGDPGLVFIDEVNRRNPLAKIGPIEATNPCGELPLLAYESCNLGSINLAKMVSEKIRDSRPDAKVDWQKLADRVYWAIRFLDNVIDVNKFPLDQIRQVSCANRKIGLGVMGFADMLIHLGISYNSPRAVTLARRLMRFIRTCSLKASMDLARQRGVFPNFKYSRYAQGKISKFSVKSGGAGLRNATVNTIAPTGTISIIAGCSSSIEPLFAISFVRNVLSGAKLFETNPLFEQAIKEQGLDREQILAKIATACSIQNIKGVSESLRKVFVTAFDVKPSQHLAIQAAFQKYTDNAVSKTINLPKEASVEDVRQIFLEAHKLKCKGITIYRYGSKKEQVLTFELPRFPQGAIPSPPEQTWIGPISADAEYSGGCATGICSF